MSTRTLTVVFTDIHGFGKRLSNSSRNTLLEYLRKHESVLLPIIVRHEGRIVSTVDDSFLLRFESPTNAVRCGLVMQHALAQHNATAEEDDKLQIRVGIHTGDVQQIGFDLFGDTVNLAYLVKEKAQPGNVFLTETTRLAMNQGEIPTSTIGEVLFKGHSNPTTLHVVDQTQDEAAYTAVIAQQDNLIKQYVRTPLPHGAYSENLLLGQERAATIRGRSSLERRPLVFAAAVLLILSVYGAYGVTQLRQQAQLRQAANELRMENPAGAFSLLTDLRRKRPSDARVVQLLSYAVVMEIQAMLNEQQFERALVRIDEHRARFPYLQVYDTIERTARISQTQYKITQQPEGPGETFEELLVRYPNDMDIRVRHAASKATLNDELGALYAYIDIIETNPEYARKPIIRQYLEMCLGKYVDQRLQTAVATHLFDSLYESLAPHVYSFDDPVLRRNSFAIFQMKGAEVDPSAYYTVELLTANPNDTQGLDLALRYFEREVIRGADPSLVANVSIVGQDFPIIGI